MRSLMLAAVAALTFATSAGATSNTYTMDTNGHCHDSKGRAVAATKCTPHRNVVCTNGVPCGDTCIPKNHICRRR